MKWAALVLVVLLLTPVGAAGQSLQVPGTGQGRLHADRVRYDARSKVFFAEGHVRLTLGTTEIRARRLRVEQIPQLVTASGEVIVRQPDAVLTAAALTYQIRSQLAVASGDVTLMQADTTVRAPEMTLALSAEIVQARGGVRLERSGSVLTGTELVAELQSRRAEVRGRAQLVRSQEQATTIAAPRISFRWDANEAEADGGVTIVQADRTVRTRTMTYSEARGVLELDGDVVVEQRSGESLVQDENAKKALAAPATLASEHLVVLLRSNDMRADGQVRVAQEGRLATGDRAVYTDRDRRIVVTGNVRLRDTDGSWLRADTVIISLTDEAFEAEGNVETEFTVQRGK